VAHSARWNFIWLTATGTNSRKMFFFTIPPAVRNASFRTFAGSGLCTSFHPHGRRPLKRPLRQMRDWAVFLESLKAVPRLRRAMRSGSYDLIHVNNTFTYQGPTMIAARLENLPVLAHIRNPIPDCWRSYKLAKIANALVSVNDSLARDFELRGIGVPVGTCYDGVQISEPHVCSFKELRRSLAPDGATLIGSAGRLDTQKDFETLIRAARVVCDARSQVHFAVAGEGPQRASLEKLIQELHLNRQFVLCGFRKDIQNFLAAIDLLVCSSLWESGPLVVLEAMWLGKPVVATQVGIAPEVVLPGVTGELTPAGNPQALATTILRALEHLRARDYQPLEARTIAKRRGDPAANAYELDRVIHETIKMKPTGSSALPAAANAVGTFGEEK
jgi:glycosyltransferase involved in cell wall biosynthesis